MDHSMIFLEPNRDGKIKIVSSEACKYKFQNYISYDKALAHVLEDSAVIVDKNTIMKLYSRDQVKELVKTRDNYICHYCGNKGFTVDHKIPKIKGGYTTPKNLVCCCNKCNTEKGEMDYEEFLLLKV